MKTFAGYVIFLMFILALPFTVVGFFCNAIYYGFKVGVMAWDKLVDLA